MTIFLKTIASIQMDNSNIHPFNIPAYGWGIDIEIHSPILIFVWENGSGKSTLLEAIADNCGFNQNWWNKHHFYGKSIKNELAKVLRLGWYSKVNQGFFMRAESFWNFSDYLDELSVQDPWIYAWYGWKSLNHMSHWEAFMSLFTNHFGKWFFILDEPESALSPTKQISFLALIAKLISNNNVQFIISTHSPFVMSIPNAQIMSISHNGIKEVDYKETEHFQITKLFLESPERFHKQFTFSK